MLQGKYEGNRGGGAVLPVLSVTTPPGMVPENSLTAPRFPVMATTKLY